MFRWKCYRIRESMDLWDILKCFVHCTVNTNLNLALSQWLLAEPRRPEERSVRVRARIQDHAVCPQQFHQFIRPVQTSIWLDWITTFVRTLYYNVTDISSPRCVCTSRLQTSSTRRPPALSGTKLYSNTRKRSRNRLRIPHDTIARLYTAQLWTVSARTSSSAQTPNSIPWKGNGAATQWRQRRLWRQ